ncbi:MAG: glycosyltransferase 61 family protein [Thiohalocapsa sp.]
MQQVVLGASPRLVTTLGSSRLRIGAPDVTVVERGLIPPLRRDSSHPPSEFYAGVYTHARDICPPSLWERWYGKVTVPYPADAAELQESVVSPVTAMYGGVLSVHFGHFLLESTERLWWAVAERFDGPIVFQAESPTDVDVPFVRRFFELLGIDQQVVVAEKAMQFGRVVVPHAAFQLRAFVYEAFRAPFAKVGEAAEIGGRAVGPSRIYLSRTRLVSRQGEPIGRVVGEEVVEEAFRRHGYDIVHPQTLSFEDQIRLVRRARTVSGVQGSALHLMLFSPGIGQAIHIMRSRDVNLSFPILDELVCDSSIYIFGSRAARRPFGSQGPFLIDVDRTLDLLGRAGVLRLGAPRPHSAGALKRLFLAEWHAQNARQMTPEGAKELPAKTNRLISALLAVALRQKPGGHGGRLKQALEVCGLGDEALALSLGELEEAAMTPAEALQPLRRAGPEWMIDALQTLRLRLGRAAGIAMELGDAYYAAGDLAAAAEAFSEALELDPQSIMAHVKLSDAFQKLGNLAEAEKIARDLRQHAPRSFLGINRLADVLLARGENDEARRVLQEAIIGGYANENSLPLFFRSAVAAEISQQCADAIASMKISQAAIAQEWTAFLEQRGMA